MAKETKEEKQKNIYQRIISVMKDVKYVQKENRKVNNQYTFVSHDAVTAVLHCPMAEHGIVFITDVVELLRDGNRTTAHLLCHFVNADDPQDRVSVNSYGDGVDPSDKGIGKAVSYAVKYALLKVFGLETGDDPERDNIPHQKPHTEADIANKKKLIQGLVSNKDAGLLKDYFLEMTEVYKKSYEEIIMATNTETFSKDFQNWKIRKESVISITNPCATA